MSLRVVFFAVPFSLAQDDSSMLQKPKWTPVTHPPSPVKCHPVGCRMYCEHGWAKGDDGCDMCKCFRCPKIKCDKECPKAGEETVGKFVMDAQGCPTCDCALSGCEFDPEPSIHQKEHPQWDHVLTECVEPGVIAMTIDDDITSDALLTSLQLKNAGIKATFFVSFPETMDYTPIEQAAMLTRIASVYHDGHQVSSHTELHCCMVEEKCDYFRNAPLCSPLEEELLGWEKKVRAAGQEIRGAPNRGGWYWLRPPFMNLDNKTTQTAWEVGYEMAWITDDTRDWAGAEKVKTCLDGVLETSTSTSHIVLQHGKHSGTQVDQTFWNDFKKKADVKGWRFVTIDECKWGTGATRK